MMESFVPIEIKAKDMTTADCSVLSFDIPAEERARFAFQHGQYLTLKAKVNGEDLRRSYSLCSSPLDGEWKVAVKKIEDGRFSTFVNDELAVGDKLEVLPPNGRFFISVDPNAARDYVAFAAGSGITPILSIIKTHLLQEPKSSFKLFYVNRTVQSIILREEIEALKNQFLGRFEIFHFLTQEERDTPIFNGRIDQDKLEAIFRLLVDIGEIDHYFMCGPESMIFLIRDFLTEKGVDLKRIHFELFNTSGAAKQKKKTRQLDGTLTSVKVISNGTALQFQMPKGGDNLLDAALRNSVDLPFACKGGVCCTCRAKITEGEVDMEVNYALEEDEVEAGFVLTCQAIPLSDTVVVDFDA
ncbi:MAG: 1,2-phenylacetyl-CoA epoxidase subunit PaaE [Bacteroidota bacterium]